MFGFNVQWLINTIRELIPSWYPVVSGSYYERGAPADYDKNIGDFIKDGAWHSWNLAAIVPANAKAVLLKCVLSNSNYLTVVRFRRYIVPSDYLDYPIQTIGSDYPVETQGVVSVEVSKIIEYKCPVDTYYQLQAVVVGWWV